MKGILSAALAFVLAAWAAQPAFAVSVSISETGAFAANASTTAESAPNGTFSFTLPSPYTGTPTTQATNFSYTLNGNPLAIGLTSVQFYISGNGGMFDLNLSNGDVFNVFGADIGSRGTIA